LLTHRDEEHDHLPNRLRDRKETLFKELSGNGARPSPSTWCLLLSGAFLQDIRHVDVQSGCQVVLMLLLLRDHFPDLLCECVMT
jgi:hypothetical protein